MNILDPRLLDQHVPPHRRRSNHDSGGAVDIAPKFNAFTDAMLDMQHAMVMFSESLSAVGGKVGEMIPLAAYQNAVMRDCLLTEAERAAADDALWECHALSIRLEPRVFQADFRMFGTTTLCLNHGLFTRNIAVEVFNPYTGEAYEPENFQLFIDSPNSITITLVGAAFRKPPFQFQTKGQRNGAIPSSLRVKVSA